MTAEPLYLQVGRLMHSKKVQDACYRAAKEIGAIATELGHADGDAEIDVSDGTRPGDHSPTGAVRSYGRVTAPLPQEYGTQTEPRRRLLARAVAAWRGGR